MVVLGAREAIQVSHSDIWIVLCSLKQVMLLLDLFIYLNFEQKQQAAHHRQFVDIYNCTE